MPNILLTKNCIHACPYCSENEELKECKEEVLSWENLIYIADLFEFSNEMQLSLIGGEPTPHPQLTDFVRYLQQRNFKVEVVTGSSLPQQDFAISPDMQVWPCAPQCNPKRKSLYDFNTVNEIKTCFSHLPTLNPLIINP